MQKAKYKFPQIIVSRFEIKGDLYMESNRYCKKNRGIWYNRAKVTEYRINTGFLAVLNRTQFSKNIRYIAKAK